MRGWVAVLFGACAAAHAAAPGVEEARSLMAENRLEQALERLDRQIAADPQDADARFTRGLVLVRLGRSDDAANAFIGLTRDFPRLPEPYNNLAVIYAQQGEYDKARRALEDALAKHPSYAVAHENLGDIHAALAAAAYNHALALDPDNASARTKLDLVSRLADADAIAPAASLAAAAAPDPAEVEKALRSWAAAWSARDAGAYLSHYAPGFMPEDGASRQDWEAQRRERITRPKRIRVEIRDLQVAAQPDGSVEARFTQHYRSDTMRNEARKRLELAPVDGRWLIRRERSR